MCYLRYIVIIFVMLTLSSCGGGGGGTESVAIKLKSGFWVIKQDEAVAFQGIFNDGFSHSLLNKNGDSHTVVTILSNSGNGSLIDVGVLANTNSNGLDIQANVNSETSVDDVSKNGSTYHFEYGQTQAVNNEIVSASLKNGSYFAEGTSQAHLELDSTGNFKLTTSQLGLFDTCIFTGTPLTTIDKVIGISTNYTCNSSITGEKIGIINTNWLAGSWDIGTLLGSQLIVEIPSSSAELYQDTSFHFHLVDVL